MTPWELAKSGTEHAEQRAFFAWANCAERYGFELANYTDTYHHVKRFDMPAVRLGAGAQGGYTPVPALRWIHAIHNQGHGDSVRGGRARAEGVKAGVFDIFWPCPKMLANGIGPRRLACGLYIEMKRQTRRNQDALSPDQKEFAQYAGPIGYHMAVCFSWQEAAKVVERYCHGEAY